MRFSTTLFSIAALLALAACGRAPDHVAAQAPPGPSASSAQAPTADSPSASSRDSRNPGALQVSDVEAYARGMHSEIQWLRSAQDKLQRARAAHDDNAMLEALAQATSSELDIAAAKAAGMDVARYGHVRNTIDGVLMTIVLKASPDAPASLKVDPYRNVSGQVATALRSRLAELQELHAKAMGLRVKLAES
jgi:hypothetical protein